MKIFWIWFKNTRYWENELCVTILAENEEQALIALLTWKSEIEKEDPDRFEEVSFNEDNLDIESKENVEFPIVLDATWD